MKQQYYKDLEDWKQSDLNKSLLWKDLTYEELKRMEKENHYLFIKLIPEQIRLLLEHEQCAKFNIRHRKRIKLYSILDLKPLNKSPHFIKGNRYSDCSIMNKNEVRDVKNKRIGYKRVENKNINGEELEATKGREIADRKENGRVSLVGSLYNENIEDFSKLISNMREKVNERMNLDQIRKSMKQLPKQVTSYNPKQELMNKANGKLFSIHKKERRKESILNGYITEPSMAHFSISKHK